MTRKTLATVEVLAVCVALLACASLRAAAAPAWPAVHVLTQPSGATFEARQWGDEWMHGWETLDGYTILLDETTGLWEYAVRSLDGRLEPSGCAVAPFSPDAVPRGFKQKTRPDKRMYETARAATRGIEAVRPAKVMNLPVLLVGFPDMAGEYSRSEFSELLFGNRPAVATGPGSLRDYYLEVSYGALALSGGTAGVQDWFTASHDHDYYGSGTSPEGPVRAAKLVREAVLVADASVDFSDYDCDGDGHVDSIVVIHAGPGAENTGNPKHIWSHSWSLQQAGLQPVVADGVIIRPLARRMWFRCFRTPTGRLIGLRDGHGASTSWWKTGSRLDSTPLFPAPAWRYGILTSTGKATAAAAASGASGLVELWNALCTMTARESAAARAILEGRRYMASDKIVGSVRRGCDAEYRVLHPRAGALAFAVGSCCGTVNVYIQAPGGDRFELNAAGDRPAVVEIPTAECGEWRVVVSSPQGPEAAAFAVWAGRREGGGADAADSWARFGPNPATRVLNVYYSLPGGSSLLVFDVAGHVVYTHTLAANGSHLEWDLVASNGSPLANGLYLVAVRSAEGQTREVFRLLVQR